MGLQLEAAQRSLAHAHVQKKKQERYSQPDTWGFASQLHLIIADLEQVSKVLESHFYSTYTEDICLSEGDAI